MTPAVFLLSLFFYFSWAKNFLVEVEDSSLEETSLKVNSLKDDSLKDDSLKDDSLEDEVVRTAGDYSDAAGDKTVLGCL